jgi:hypothetical protein
MSDMGDEVTAHQGPRGAGAVLLLAAALVVQGRASVSRLAWRSGAIPQAASDNGPVAQCRGQTGQGLPRCA